jgi:uncharacterized protein (TIGR03435 family)
MTFFGGPRTRAGRYELRNASLVDLISTAYGVHVNEILGGPNWVELDKFDVTAKLPPDVRPEAQKNMLQALLADRFKLVIQTETRSLPGYALTAGKHPQVKEAAGSGGSCDYRYPTLPPASPGGGPASSMMLTTTCKNMSMAQFAEELRRNLEGKPVIDQTGLKGSWDFGYKVTALRVADSAMITTEDALEKQLGLKLDPIKAPMPVIIIKSVNRKPTDNAADIAGILHIQPPPTEFEVAEVKLSDPNAGPRRRGIQIQNGGRVSVSGMTLELMILGAWNLNEEMLVDAPKWLGDQEFDIIAKATTGPPSAETQGTDIDLDAVWVMMRSLLADRFKLKTHFEDRPLPAYTLMAVKPKLKQADPASRTKFIGNLPLGSKDDPRTKNPALTRLIIGQNVTMAQFAEQLQRTAPGYVRTPVLDATGLEGGWDFTLAFSSAGQNGGGGAGDAAPLSAGASDPSGAISLFNAMKQQLGLKLELGKRPVQVLVIDHIEAKPTEN